MDQRLSVPAAFARTFLAHSAFEVALDCEFETLQAGRADGDGWAGDPAGRRAPALRGPWRVPPLPCAPQDALIVQHLQSGHALARAGEPGLGRTRTAEAAAWGSGPLPDVALTKAAKKPGWATAPAKRGFAIIAADGVGAPRGRLDVVAESA